MLASKEKISIRQAMIILLTISYTPSLRVIPGFAAKEAKQAAWLSPLITLVVIIPIIFMYSTIYKKYKDESLTEVIEDIFGAVAGKITTVFFIILFTLVLITNTRNYAEKLMSSVYPHANMLIFFLVMLFTVAVITRRGGIVVLARMNEIIVVILVIIFLTIFILACNDIKISRLTPISYLDFFPVVKANTGVMDVWAVFSLIFLISNYINNKEKIKKVCIQASVLLAFLTVILIVVTIGLLGASTIELSPLPYITAVKQISVFHTLERIEAFDVSLWIFSDFMFISISLFAILNMYKSLFKLSDTRPLINIYLVITYFMALMIQRNIFEMEVFSETVIFPANIFLGFVVPVLVFIVGKVRKKV